MGKRFNVPLSQSRFSAKTSLHFTIITTFAIVVFLSAMAAGEQPANKTDQVPPDETILSEELLLDDAGEDSLPESGEAEDAAADRAGKGKATISADRIIHEGGRDVSRAFGDVEITYGGKTITGDEGQINHESGEGYINGNVHFSDGNSDIISDRIKFNASTNRETLYNAKGSTVNDFYFTGERIDRVEDDRYLIYNGTCSTCPHTKKSWRFDVKKVDLTAEGYAFMKGVTLRAGNVPVLYLPYFIVSAKTKRATGFLTPYAAQSSKRGWLINNSFFWAIKENMDATFTHEYLGKAGNQFGLEYRYILAPGTQGQLNAQYLKETDPDKPSDRDLWKVIYNHTHKLPMGISNITHIDRESEVSIAREYEDNVNERTRRYSDSYTYFKRSWSTRDLRIQARLRESTLPDQSDEMNTLPEIHFTNQAQKLWGSPVYGSLGSSFVSYRTKSTRGEETGRYDVNRYDINPNLSLPIAVAPWLSVTPAAGYRWTSYSNGIENGEQVQENFIREYYTASLSVSGPKFFRIFNTSSEKKPKLKHLITPSVTWSYQPGYEFDGEDRQKVVVLDNIDRSNPANIVTYQIVNQLIVKEIIIPEETKMIKKEVEGPDGSPIFEDELTIVRPGKSRTLQAVRFRIAQSYNINEANRTENPEVEKRPFSAIVFDLDTKPFDWLMLNYDTTYNVYDAVWESSNVEIGFRYKDIIHFALDRSFKYPTTAWDTAYLEVGLPFIRSTIDYSIVYNEETQETYDSVLRYKYKPGCWSFSLNWYKRKISVTDASGVSKLEDETKFLFMISLTGVGDLFGESKAPVAGRKL